LNHKNLYAKSFQKVAESYWKFSGSFQTVADSFQVVQGFRL